MGVIRPRHSPPPPQLERNPHVPSGGRARASGSSFYHLSFRSGSRAHGSCATASFAYVTRTGEYEDPDRDTAVYTESDHLPAWAKDDPRDYWDAADLYERANGRLYLSADFALPRDLELQDQIALVHAFAQELTGAEHLPYTFAIHAGREADGREHNPHAHLMISERQSDGVERNREQWFRRANSSHPERGGAPKSRTFHGREWMERARERWAALTNATLEERGRDERVDHRSYERQGSDREPGAHFGPAAAHLVGRGREYDRLDEAAEVAECRDALQPIDGEIDQLERARAGLARDSGDRADDSPGPRERPDEAAPDRDDGVPGR